MTNKRSKSTSKKCSNHLPSHIGEAFLRDLTVLVTELSARGGFKEKYLENEFLTKYCDPKTTSPEVRRSSAIKKWLSVEKRNECTNARITLGEEDFGWSTSDIIIDDARCIIKKVLGSVNVDRIFLDPSHTNGASTRIRRSPKALIDKHEGKAHVSSSALAHWYCLASNTRLANQPLELQECSELFTVPKSTDIDRVACKEPEVNMLLQRCVGGYIRRQLAIFGINLNDQTKNQFLAREALNRGLATIDLSSASDSISNSLVMALLPTDWWVLMDDLRVHYASYKMDPKQDNAQVHKLQMFSSMGNGFTFELESLLFWALTRSICKNSGVRGPISVYGDDIIAPAKIGARLKRTFAWFGFTVNAKKSHWSGPFRESCGKHYHNSLEVTPFYVRKPVSEKSEMIRLLNRLLVWDADPHFKCMCTQEVAEFHVKWSKQIPKQLWGGTNPEDVTSLVTGHLPRKRLLQNKRRISYNNTYGMEAWFLMTHHLEKDGVPGLDQTVDLTAGNFSLLEKFLVDLNSLDPRNEGTYTVSDPEPFRVKDSGVFDAGEVTTWSPYLVFGDSIVHHTATSEKGCPLDTLITRIEGGWLLANS